MITHRNTHLNVVGTLLHLPMRMTDRYLWTLPMFHANGWTYVWIVTAVGGERVTWMCAAPTVLIGLANAPKEARARAPKGVHVVAAGAPPAAATIERIEGALGWTIQQGYGL